MATMQDVANLARVSLSTVSCALSGSRPVSAATRERIEKAMRELDFRPNAIARSLASRRSRILALVFPAIENTLGTTVMEFVSSAAETARTRGYHLVVWPLAPGETAEMLEPSRQGLVDGVLVMEVRLTDPRAAALHAAKIPFTLIGRAGTEFDQRAVDIDFETTARVAVEHLTDLGHRHIAFLNHSQASRDAGYGPTIRGEQAFRIAMENAGLESISVHCDETAHAGRKAVATVLDSHPDTTALVAMNEDAMFGVMAELAHRGIVVPRDFSVLSMISSPRVAEAVDPLLTTLHAPGTELGRRGVSALLDQLEGVGELLGPILVPCRFEPGDSTGPVRSAASRARRTTRRPGG